MADDFDGLPGLGGAVNAAILIDNDATPNRVVDGSSPFHVTVTWKVFPPSVAVLLDGKWTLKVYAESIGPGPEREIGQVNVAGNGGPSYTGHITVPAGTLASDVGPFSGLYKLGAVITYRTAIGVLTEIAGFSEGPTFLLREP